MVVKKDDTLAIKKCPACLQNIVFVPLKSGKKMPCLADRIRVVINGEVVLAHYPHWQDCSDPNRFRKE